MYKFRQVKKTGEYREVVCKSYSDSSYWFRACLKKYEIIIKINLKGDISINGKSIKRKLEKAFI